MDAGCVAQRDVSVSDAHIPSISGAHAKVGGQAESADTTEVTRWIANSRTLPDAGS